jgi:CRISPR-associated protein Csd1
MILQSLVELYERRCASEDPEQRLPEPGWQNKEIAFVVDVSTDGRPLGVHDLRQPQPKGRPRAPQRLVPQEHKRPGKIPDEPTESDAGKAFLLWDNPKYALGIPADDDPKTLKDAATCHGLFKIKNESFLAKLDDSGARALEYFLASDVPTSIRAIASDELWAEMRSSGANVAFRLSGDTELICQRPTVRAAITAAAFQSEDALAPAECIVSGRIGPIARLHPAIKGVRGAQSSGADIVSFNLPAFEGYGFDQGANAPVSSYAAFAYTTTLNALLARESGYRAQAGNVTVVFWAGRATPNEGVICPFLVAIAADDPGRGTPDLKALYAAPITGARPCTEDETPFLILGLSAESRSRLTVRFFHQGTIKEVARNIVAWHEALHIAPEDGTPLSIHRLLRGLAVRGEIENAPSLLGAELLKCAYTGAPFPQRVLAEALVRCAAERGPTRERAALVKAFLIRNCRRRVPVDLEADESDTAYRLGRLFAVLEWVQERAVNAKAGIAERYWGSASTTPAFVFADLLNLAVHHLSKLDDTAPGFATNRRKEIEAIVAQPAPLPARLPARLELVDQGSFALGYWQQRAARRSSTDKPVITDATEKDAAR